MTRTFLLASLVSTAVYVTIGWVLIRTGAAFDWIGRAPRIRGER